jgi:hypothetical protein
MRFALVDGIKTEAAPKLRGTCPHCPPDGASRMIAKCGRYVRWHWAHESRRHCDPWWEPETEWHRAWKEQFSPAWQEVLHVDPSTGERHIADVKSGDGLVLEFQHSPLDLAELRAREAFYERLVWVVDGMRGPLDRDHFHIGLEKPTADAPALHPFQWFARGKLFHAWRLARAPVFFDFGHDVLWRLVAFDPRSRKGMVEAFGRERFVTMYGGAVTPSPAARDGGSVAEDVSGWGARPAGRAPRGR